MYEQSKPFFEALKKDREDSANTLEKPSMRGVQRSLLLKNIQIKLILYMNFYKMPMMLKLQNELIFKHNGKRHFSVSNPINEFEDSKLGKLGDINSITSIANSNKSGPKIGKFGVGFKAVFQYTIKPMIFDPNFFFQIDRFIVPSLLNEDYKGRKDDETIFVFPFNNPEKKAIDTFNDILGKFQNLTYPLLFLTKLNEIYLMIEDKYFGKYGKRIEKNYNIEDINIQLICLFNEFKNKKDEQKLWLFTSHCISNKIPYSISVGFFVDDKGKLKPVNDCAFCFFQT